jgi:hypothetical protein
MKCSRCQHEDPPLPRVCFECGGRFALTRSTYETKIPASVKFCDHCLPGSGVSKSAFASSKSYTPEHLGERILNFKVAV